MTPPTPPSRDAVAARSLEPLVLPFAETAMDRKTVHWLRWVYQQVSELSDTAVDKAVREAVVSLIRGMGALAFPPMPTVHISLDHEGVTLRWFLADEFVVASVRRRASRSSADPVELRFEGQWRRPLRGADVVSETHRAHTAAQLLGHMWRGLASLRQLADLQAAHISTIERILQEADLYCVAGLKEGVGVQVYRAEARAIARQLGGHNDGRREVLRLLLAVHGDSADGHVFPVYVRGRYLWAADQLREGVIVPLSRARRGSPDWRTGQASPWLHPTRWSEPA